MVFKIDMAKAYDRLEWQFLLKAMEAFGFSAASRDLDYRNICSIWYTFKINGVETGEFRSFRGVQQGILCPRFSLFWHNKFCLLIRTFVLMQVRSPDIKWVDMKSACHIYFMPTMFSFSLMGLKDPEAIYEAYEGV